MKTLSVITIRFSLLLLLLIPFTTHAQLASYMEASLVLGQPDLTSNTLNNGGIGANTLYGPTGIAIDPTTQKIFVSDQRNHRVLRYASIGELINGANAEIVLGQANFTSNLANRGGVCAANTFSNPVDLFVDDDGTLWVSDYDNNRVLKFLNASTITTGADADGVLGQTNFTNHGGVALQNRFNAPRMLWIDDNGTLWVNDGNNYRILRFDDAKNKSNGANADGVLGQTNFTNTLFGATQNTFKSNPRGLFIDDDGSLYVADPVANRILVWHNAKNKSNGANADRVIGQNDYTSWASGTGQSDFSAPASIFVDTSDRLYVSEAGNYRILVFENASTISNKTNANYILGKDVYGNSVINYPNPPGTPTAKSLYTHYGEFWYDTNTGYMLYTDRYNNRMLAYDIEGNPPSFVDTYAKLLNTTSTTSDLAAKFSDFPGKVYFVVLPSGSNAPSATQVKNGQNASGTAVDANRKGTITLAAINTEYTSTISGLVPNETYDIYLVRTNTNVTQISGTEYIRLQTSQSSQNGDGDINAGFTGKKIIATITNNNGNSNANYLSVFTVGTGTIGLGNIPNGETVPAGVTQRIDFIWGVDETGDVVADIIFDYSLIPGLTNTQELRLLKRNDANDDWIDITHLAFHDIENKRFILYNQSSFSEFTVGAIPGAGGFAFSNNYPDISDIGGPSITLTSNLTQAGNVYYLVVESGNAAPTQAQIKTPSTYPDAYVASGNTMGLTAGTDFINEVTGLASSKSYTVYMFAEKPDLSTSTSTASTSFNSGNGVPVSDWVVPIVLFLILATIVMRYKFRLHLYC